MDEGYRLLPKKSESKSESRKYVESEAVYIPKHFDEQTKALIEMMLTEAYNAGRTAGYDKGLETGKSVAVFLLNDVIDHLKK